MASVLVLAQAHRSCPQGCLTTSAGHELSYLTALNLTVFICELEMVIPFLLPEFEKIE